MGFLDDGYFSDLAQSAIDNLGFGSGSAAASTIGKVYQETKNSSSPVTTAAASSATPIAGTNLVLGMTPTELVMIAGGVILAAILIKKALK